MFYTPRELPLDVGCAAATNKNRERPCFKANSHGLTGHYRCSGADFLKPDSKGHIKVQKKQKN